MKRIFVGTFTDSQLNAGEDKKRIEEIQKTDSTLKYITSSLVKKNREYVAVKVFLHDFESYNDQDKVQEE